MGIRRRAPARVIGAALVLLVALGAGCSEDDDAAPAPATTGVVVTAAPTTTARPRTTVADPVATVTGPIEGGTYGVPYNPAPLELLDEYGYVEAEFFLAGTATAYAPTSPLTVDGAWTVQPTTTAPYTTRIIVRRPADDATFNGTVFVEWLNVTAGIDSDPHFGQGHREMLRRGAAYVGVSAQSVGVMGGGARIPIEGVNVQPLREWDPVRYGALSHPGDAFSYDMFSQAAQLLRAPGTVDPLAGLEPEILIAAGESQSASRMVTYANAVQPLANRFDGILIHSRGRGAAPLNAEPTASPAAGTLIRTDLDVPVFIVQTETDLLRLGSLTARQPDTPRLRTWEVAGTAHADTNTLAYGQASGAVWNPAGVADLGALCGSINDGPLSFVLRRALRDLDAWARGGAAPESAPPIETLDGVIARDELGIARGGIRTPAVDVPVAVLSGDPPAGSSVLCSLFGSSTPLTDAELAARYPTRATYVDAVRVAADAAVAAGFLLAVDVDEITGAAETAPLPV